MRPLFTLTIITIFLLIGQNAFADKVDESKERLQELQENVQRQDEEITAKNKAIKDMEKKIDCNYKLLQAYNKCEENQDKSSKEYPACIEKARKQNPGCAPK